MPGWETRTTLQAPIWGVCGCRIVARGDPCDLVTKGTTAAFERPAEPTVALTTGHASFCGIDILTFA